ncbi:MAG: nucleotidyl transferase AbiEii/AbiGii toxin family protein [Candidatus Rokubacteria bacterium]|nr:nucleotidyl transferase AbiEii/AbiGii toxin family protein [Candidatus Rokubacteria bacterium]
MTERVPLRLHEDTAFFREAVSFTSAQTGFAARLIEKDYFCSVLLQDLAATAPDLIFRGGTCLAKVHMGFYRLSEDLDFLVSTPVESTRTQRSRRAAEPKAAVATIEKRLAGLHVVTPFTGANDSSQYIGVIGYRSLLAEREETIRIEIGLREPLLTRAIGGEAKTLVLDPVSRLPVVPVFPVPCLSREEAMADKLRAALSRRDAAIRDFYDVDHAVRLLGFRLHDSSLVELIRQKLGVPGNEPVDISANRLAALKLQLESQLKPVLRDQDFADFDLDRAFAIVAETAVALG